MYHRLRSLHRWVGLVCALFLLIISGTGLFLALKSRFDWIRPPTQTGSEVGSLAEIVPVSRVVEAAFGAGYPELRSRDDIDRVEYHASKNVFKVHSKKGYREVQVCGGTGRVLATGQRNDQLLENIHDLRFFHPVLRETLLPVVAVGLFGLSCSGVVIALVPIVRRARFRRQKAGR